MDDYIEREAFKSKYLCCGYLPEMSEEEFNDFPAADVAPVVHGKWERVANPKWPAHIHDKCSVCGWWNTRNALCYDGSNKPGHSLNYCPNCGAKMDGDDK